MASAFKEKEYCIYRHEALVHIASCPVYFSMPGPHLDQEASTCDAPQPPVGCGAECFCHWITPVCQRLWGWWHIWLWAAGSVHQPQCWWKQRIDWLLPMGGLQNGRGIINCFSLLGLAEVTNTCRAAKSAVTCQHMGSWAPSNHCLFSPFLLFKNLRWVCMC